jgi:hypothetical protein
MIIQFNSAFIQPVVNSSSLPTDSNYGGWDAKGGGKLSSCEGLYILGYNAVQSVELCLLSQKTEIFITPRCENVKSYILYIRDLWLSRLVPDEAFKMIYVKWMRMKSTYKNMNICSYKHGSTNSFFPSYNPAHFFLLVGWDFWYCGHHWPIVPAPDDRWWRLWKNWWNEDWQGQPKYSEKTCPSGTLSTTNPTWLDPGLNPDRSGGKPATNRLSYSAA